MISGEACLLRACDVRIDGQRKIHNTRKGFGITGGGDRRTSTAFHIRALTASFVLRRSAAPGSTPAGAASR